MTFMSHMLASILPVALAVGCAQPQKVNPSFDVTAATAREAIRDMRASPQPLARPLVILGGFADPGFGTSALRQAYKPLFEQSSDRILVLTFIDCTSFQQCREKVIAAVDAKFPSSDAKFTTEVDVIGMSMGGLVARVSAETGAPDERRLKIARLFTLASPLRGAKLAEFPVVLTSMHRDMREGSALLDQLNDTEPSYPVYAYTRLHDPIVGADLAAPKGRTAWWVDNPPFQAAHMGLMIDPRILADVARRLRGEQPFAQDPPAPLPARS